MKALLCKQHGLPDTLSIEEVADPQPGPDEVVVDVRAAGVNFPDVLIIQNKYQFKPELPFSPGGEMSGIVSAVGSNVTHLRPGDKVLGLCSWGAFAEKVKLSANRAIPVPDGIAFDAAAAFLLTYGTSWHALKDRGALQKGETLLVLGASGGVGISAIQIGKALGARVIAAASTEEKLQVCRDNGADETINYTTENLRDRLKELTGGNGPDVIYDPVGGEYAEPAFRSIGWRGRYLVIGFANGEIPRLPLNLTLLKGASLIGVFWGSFTQREPENFRRDVRDMFELMQQGVLKPHISAHYPLAEARQALNDMMNRKVTGKVVIQISE